MGHYNVNVVYGPFDSYIFFTAMGGDLIEYMLYDSTSRRKEACYACDVI